MVRALAVLAESAWVSVAVMITMATLVATLPPSPVRPPASFPAAALAKPRAPAGGRAALGHDPGEEVAADVGVSRHVVPGGGSEDGRWGMKCAPKITLKVLLVSALALGTFHNSAPKRYEVNDD